MKKLIAMLLALSMLALTACAFPGLPQWPAGDTVPDEIPDKPADGSLTETGGGLKQPEDGKQEEAEEPEEERTEPVTIEDIAAQLGISAGYLHRIFRHVKNCSILDCLNRKRVIAAIELMENRNLSLKEAAYNVGIEDPAYMSRLFKKVTGLSCREYFRDRRI